MPIVSVPTQEAAVVTKGACFLVVVLALAACSQGVPGGAPSGSDGDKIVLTGDQKADWAQILALENEAQALVKTDGCLSVGQCRTVPVGSRACGGPRYYLVYCSRSTDSVALFRKLDAIAAGEREYNTKYKIMSTCEFRLRPKVALSGGSCLAQ
jgi:hypothetical protein